MKKLAAAGSPPPLDRYDEGIPPIDLQSLVDGIAILDRFDSVLAGVEQSLGADAAPEPEQ